MSSFDELGIGAENNAAMQDFPPVGQVEFSTPGDAKKAAELFNKLDAEARLRLNRALVVAAIEIVSHRARIAKLTMAEAELQVLGILKTHLGAK